MYLAVPMGSSLASGMFPAENRRACEAGTAVAYADEPLVEAARAGQAGAFTEIVRRWKARVFSMAAKYARNHHELEDLAQDIFIRAWRGLGGYRGAAPFEHWLTKIAVRTCFDFLRRHRRRREKEISSDALPEFCGLYGGEAPAETAENHALLLVRLALGRLRPKEQLVLTLLELEDRPVKEVAVLTGWSEGNVKVRAHRARTSLRAVIEDLRREGIPG